MMIEKRYEGKFFMPVKNHGLIFQTANCMHLKLHHFARGTYPVRSRAFSTLPVNRFFIVESNPNKEACRIEDEKTSFVLKPGTAYFAPLHYECNFQLDEKLEFISIHFTLELYEGIDIFSGFGKICEICDPLWLSRARQAFENFSEFSGALQLRGLVSDFAALLGSGMSCEQWDNVTRFAHFRRELDYLQSRPPARVTVDELAELHGVSRECFSRKFTRMTGISPKHFLTQTVISRACRDLIFSKELIKEIAFELGFANEFYFSRFFSKQMGISPREYRQRGKLR